MRKERMGKHQKKSERRMGISSGKHESIRSTISKQIYLGI